MIDRLFNLASSGTSVRTEILAGVTTFVTMAYIIFVQPAVLSGRMFGIETGIDFGAVMTATCVSAAFIEPWKAAMPPGSTVPQARS